jgi:streptogramin lyase
MRRLVTAIALSSLLLACAEIAGAKTPPDVVATGPGPCGIAAGHRSLWVGVYGAGTLVRIDAHAGRATRVRVGPWACRVSVGPSAVWVTRDRANELVRVPVGPGSLRRVRVAEPFDVLRAAGSLWATSHSTGTVVKLDPGSGAVLSTVPVAPRPAGLALCGGRVWVGHGASSALSTIDPDTLEVRRVGVGAEAPGWPACILDTVWAVTPDSVVRVDPESGRVLSRLRLGETLADAAAGPDGYVWVTDKQHSLVHRLTPDGRHRVDRRPAGPGAFALVRLGGSVWVTSFAGSDVRRFDP